MNTNKLMEIKNLVLEILNEQKATDIAIIDLTKKSDLANYIILATGTSNKHLFTLKEKIRTNLKSKKVSVYAIDGEESDNWIVIDLDSIIIHLFKKEVREYYKIEEIWT